MNERGNFKDIGVAFNIGKWFLWENGTLWIGEQEQELLKISMQCSF